MRSEFLTTNQVAAELGVTPQRVRALIRSGRLKAKTIGEGNRATYLILPADLEAVRDRKPGRPRKLPRERLVGKSSKGKTAATNEDKRRTAS